MNPFFTRAVRFAPLPPVLRVPAERPRADDAKFDLITIERRNLISGEAAIFAEAADKQPARVRPIVGDESGGPRVDGRVEILARLETEFADRLLNAQWLCPRQRARRPRHLVVRPQEAEVDALRVVFVRSRDREEIVFLVGDEHKILPVCAIGQRRCHRRHQQCAQDCCAPYPSDTTSSDGS